MKNSPEPERSGDLNRRRFIGAIGAAAASTALFPKIAGADDGTVMYQDSFGNIVPAALDALAAGVVPPPIVFPEDQAPPTQDAADRRNIGYDVAQDSRERLSPDDNPPCTGTYVSNTTIPNILLIMVDQLRSPRWVPTNGGQAYLDTITQKITTLRNHSVIFTNYFTAATKCTPSRATLLTGLYSQQTAMFTTADAANVPTLQTGYPTFAAALTQSLLKYTATWIGKWHLSDGQPNITTPGKNGPDDYSFNGKYNLPSAATNKTKIYSPNGLANEGTDGLFGNTQVSATPPLMTTQPYQTNSYSDAAIASWFANDWLANGGAALQPWFTAVSFVNPHDMAQFPSTFAFTSQDQGNFGPPAVQPTIGFEPPLVTNSELPLHEFYSASNVPALYEGAPWNVADVPSGYNGGAGKPDLQSYFLSDQEKKVGSVTPPNGWYTFLNYYFWMQQWVDQQIGSVIQSLSGDPSWANTVIVFTADHGDYGGSHGLHDKGGALYDEALNVPLYISYPGMRKNYFVTGDNTSFSRSYLCSSVDLFAFFYETALGNASWRKTCSNDPYFYLAGRESIADAVMSGPPPAQRRMTNILNSAGTGNLPYVLHTTDEYPCAPANVPNHAIALRTMDTTTPTYNGGGKLGIYAYWTPGTTAIQSLSLTGSSSAQFEFYDYTNGANYGETGNSAITNGALTAEAHAYLSFFESLAPGGGSNGKELYDFSPLPVQQNRQAALSLYFAYVNAECGS